VVNDGAQRGAAVTGRTAKEMQRLQAALTYVDGRFQPNVQIGLDSDGRITRIGPDLGTPVEQLNDVALIPGLINVHSHAFQRALRGRGEHFPAGAGDFWHWREAMYALVEQITPDRLGQVCRDAFGEMLGAGVTTVGEFHYLHHEDPRKLDFALDDVVLDAAEAAGIRIVLLMCYYRTGGVGRPLAGGQRRFATPDVDQFLRQVDRLAGRLRSERQSLAIAPHSVRAVPVDDIRRLHQAALERGMPFHIHVEEQRKEVEEFQAAHGVRPLRWMLDNLDVGPHVTAVHCTHAAASDLDELRDRGGNVCVCPITEGNLGDGIGAIDRSMVRPDAVCVGSDSNIRIDPLEELRWLEFAQRLRLERRGICRAPDGDVGRRLIEVGTINGARALGLPAGRLAPGALADLTLLRLSDGPLAAIATEALPSALVFSCGGREVCSGAYVTGRASRLASAGPQAPGVVS
jgi:formimidoylglutamate deiminase